MNDPNFNQEAKLSENVPHRYWCFISYRHADNHEQDRQWATWLHQEIEHYEIPAELVGTTNQRGDVIPAKIYPVFRDEESLSAEAHLGTGILEALDASQTLVVICSPRAVESKYVKSEIIRFQETGKGDRIITAIIDGEPNHPERECFPEPLRKSRLSDGSLNLNEGPLAADFRLPNGKEGYTSVEAFKLTMLKAGHSKTHVRDRANTYENKHQLMKLKVIAGVLDVSLETLRNRDQAYRLLLSRKRATTLKRWLSVVGILCLATIIAAIIAATNRDRALKEEAKAKKSAYRTQIQLSSTLINQRELSNARITLLSVIPEQRRWEWAYLISVCGASPALLDSINSSNNWFTTKHTDLLIDLLKNANRGPSTQEQIKISKQNLREGKIITLSSPSWRGGSHSVAYQGNPQSTLYSVWYGKYGEAGAATISADGTTIAWDGTCDDPDGRRGNLSSGDLVVSSPAVAPIPHLVSLPETLVSKEDTQEDSETDPLLRQDKLAFGPTSIDPITTNNCKVIVNDDESVSFIWPEGEAFRKLTTTINATEAAYVDSASVIQNVSDDKGLALISRLEKRKMNRKFCCSLNTQNLHGAILEGNGLELWNMDTDEKILSISAASKVPAENQDGADPADWWAHDAIQIGPTSKIAGWHDTAEGKFLGIKDCDGTSLVELLYNDNGEKIPEPATWGLPYKTSTQMLSSADGMELVYFSQGRNDSEFLYWDLTKSNKATFNRDAPRGIGWDDHGKFTAVVDIDGKLSIRESLFGKVIRSYAGINVEAGLGGDLAMPVRYSPDGSRILISNLLVDSKSHDPIFVLKPGTVISDDWNTVVTWLDSRTAQITSIRFWNAYQKKEKSPDLRLSDLLLINQISSLDRSLPPNRLDFVDVVQQQINSIFRFGDGEE